MRSTAIARTAALAGVLCLVAAAPVRGQMVEIPTFTVGVPPPFQIIRDVDAAVGTDGTLMFFYGHVAPANGLVLATMTRHFTSGGTALGDPQLLFDYAHDLAPLRVIAVPAGTVTAALPGVDPRFPGGYLATWMYRDVAFIAAARLDPDGIPDGRYGFQVDQTTGDRKGREVGAVTLAHGAAFIWFNEDPPNSHTGIVSMRVHGPSVPTGNVVELGIGRDTSYVAAAALPNDGVVFVWGSPGGGPQRGAVQVFDPGPVARGSTFAPSTASVARRVAANPVGDVIAVIGTRPETETPTELWARRFDRDGNPLGAEFLVHAAAPGATIDGADVEFDGFGNLDVVWSDGGVLRTRVFDPNDVAAGPALTLATGVGASVDVERLPNGSLLNSWVLTAAGAGARADVVTSCVAGSAVCGDGTHQPFCEACDDGAGNSDTLPDACRTDCRPARCGDGVVDGGEGCDDGNLADCDGCSATCAPEVGNVCGDGIVLASCGEQCDDGNGVAGDGCSVGCRLERVPGGGPAKNDCYAEWLVDDAANTPRFDKHGAFSARHVCVDGDPRCDFDGGAPGCLMHLKVCANNTDIAACIPPSRLLRWELKAPSESKAARDPASAAVRTALLGVVPATTVGPEARDFCSPTIAVPVALRGAAADHRGVVKLKSRAYPYAGNFDTDNLMLTCLPAVP